MPALRPILTTATLALALAPAAPAGAALLPGLVADGPTAPGVAIDVGDTDLSRDGTGGVAYTRGGDVYVAALTGGAVGSPVLVEALAGAASEPRLAAGDGGRLTVVFLHGGKLQAVTRAALGEAFSAPADVAAPQPGHTQDDPSIDTDPSGRGYVVWHETNGVDDDARAARLDGGGFTALAGVLDTDDATRQGGRANNTPGVQVGVDRDGRGVAALGEGLDELWVRRLDALTGSAPVRMDPPAYGGLNASAAGNRNLEQVNLSVDADGTAWVAWREQFDEGGNNRSRAMARPLTGLTPGETRDLDGLTTPIGMAGGEFPRVSAAGGHVLGASYGQFDGRIWGARHGGIPVTPQRLDSDDPATNTKPQPAIGNSGAGLVAYSSGTDAIRARLLSPAGLEAGEAVLSGAFGATGLPSAGRHAAATPAGDVLVAFRQRTAGAEDRLVVALLDQAPAPARDLRVEGLTARWTPAGDLWGAVEQEVRVDGATVDRLGPSAAARELGALTPGDHTVEVVARDSRGQTASSGAVLFSVAPPPSGGGAGGGGAGGGGAGGGATTVVPPDRQRPTLSFKAPSRVRRGRLVSFRVTARDASGIARITYRCGRKGTFRRLRTRARVRCRAPRRTGTLRITVRATDRAGNLKQRTVSVRVRR